MRLSMLSLILIVGSFGCSHAPVMPTPPVMERCLMLETGLECRAIDGRKFQEPYPGKQPRLCMPLPDWEARQNWEKAVGR